MYPIGTSVWYRNLCFRIVQIYKLEDGRIVYELEPSLGFRSPDNTIMALASMVHLDLFHSHDIKWKPKEGA